MNTTASATQFVKSDHATLELLSQTAAEQRRLEALKADMKIDKKDVLRLLDRLYRLCDKLRITRLKHAMLVKKNDLALYATPSLANADQTYITGRLLMVLGSIIVALVMDYFLFKSAVFYLLRQVGIDTASGFAFIATLLVPCMVVALEMVLASSLYYAWDKKKRTFGSYLVAVAYSIICAAITVVMPLISAATFLASENAASFSDLDASMQLLFTGLLVLSFTIHAVIVFSGKQANEGKALVLKVLREFRINRLTLRSARLENAAYEAFRKYKQRRDAFNQEYEETGFALGFGPFDEKTRALINNRVGREEIPEI